jgi:hypothetical protein
MSEQNAFAAAARAHDHKDLARFDLEIETTEHLLPMETLAKSADFDADTAMI